MSNPKSYQFYAGDPKPEAAGEVSQLTDEDVAAANLNYAQYCQKKLVDANILLRHYKDKTESLEAELQQLRDEFDKSQDAIVATFADFEKTTPDHWSSQINFVCSYYSGAMHTINALDKAKREAESELQRVREDNADNIRSFELCAESLKASHEETMRWIGKHDELAELRRREGNPDDPTIHSPKDLAWICDLLMDVHRLG